MIAYDVMRLEANGSRRLMISFPTEAEAETWLTDAGAEYDAGRGVWFDGLGEAFVVEGIA